MARWLKVAAAAGVAIGAVLFFGVVPAGSDAIDPAGACYGEGTWVDEGVTRTAAELEPGQLVKIPQSDTVDWKGGIGNAEPGDTTDPRTTGGAVQLKIAGKWITLDHAWENDDATFLANDGSYDYDLPDLLVGVKLPLRGHHTEESVTCAGHVVVQVEGAATENPLTWGGIGGLVIGGGMLVFAGRAVMRAEAPL